ncbi:hypothetical protein [Brevundimonas faecalis]|uniref:UDP-N-acetylglucosamine acyltransferase n=1 Tax=Brevundimonas faecalis TaxID=947378 RepID=A0ABV2R878_9CAUL
MRHRSEVARRAAVALVGLGLLSLGACASAARPDAMTVLPSTITIAQAGDFGHGAIKIANVSGGTETNPLLWSEVASGDFRQALENSLKAAGYLGATADAPLSLTASMLELKQPMAGFDMSVTSRVRYSVTDSSGRIVFDDTVAATGTARMGESLIGMERLRLANEYAIRENIKAFIERFRTRTAR